MLLVILKFFKNNRKKTTNQTEFRIEKLIKKEVNKYFKTL